MVVQKRMADTAAWYKGDAHLGPTAADVADALGGAAVVGEGARPTQPRRCFAGCPWPNSGR